MGINLEVIHEELIILLNRFHSLCTENGIKYSLHGGTLLGAVREKGFIPWDDDADITLTRAEYEKLKPVLRGDIGDEFRFDENSRFPKFVMKREGKPPVWTDIFIYDYISEKPLARKLKLAGNYFFVLFTRTKEEQRLSNINGLYSGIKKLVMNAIVAIGGLFPMELRLKWASKNMQSFAGGKTLIHRANDQYVGIPLTLRTEVMDEYITVPFENTELMISAKFDEILTSSYGADYMTPRKMKPDEMHSLSFETEQRMFAETLFNNRP